MNKRDLQDLIEHLRRHLGERLDAVVLFGSRARGEATEESDWDLLIVVEGLPRSPLDRQRLWLSVAPREWRACAAPLLRTPEEWYRRVTPLSLDIALDGVILYDAQGRMKHFLKKLRRQIRHIGLVRRRIHGQPVWLWQQGSPPQGWEKRLQEVAKT
ncbi:nucleotidyltransferase family protein [Thermodesulfatator autotrophicus]|uniref:Polymerase nucleotidyl transferase domain-containing protein n=1 Tax=Thermodesulfatator autotrophicus TaxID=1795632 RepID=A0A177E9C3_9BACT|nr:nucleotidyltransferase domain-containing protein [Thermodesulfatator autotrophicus]OAG28553.1 hypothetical protein TH606_00940 [Thermodesulfatator autotrophicus]